MTTLPSPIHERHVADSECVRLLNSTIKAITRAERSGCWIASQWRCKSRSELALAAMARLRERVNEMNGVCNDMQKM